jgi:hypothetical protein
LAVEKSSAAGSARNRSGGLDELNPFKRPETGYESLGEGQLETLWGADGEDSFSGLETRGRSYRNRRSYESGDTKLDEVMLRIHVRNGGGPGLLSPPEADGCGLFYHMAIRNHSLGGHHHPTPLAHDSAVRSHRLYEKDRRRHLLKELLWGKGSGWRFDGRSRDLGGRSSSPEGEDRAEG